MTETKSICFWIVDKPELVLGTFWLHLIFISNFKSFWTNLSSILLDFIMIKMENIYRDGTCVCWESYFQNKHCWRNCCNLDNELQKWIVFAKPIYTNKYWYFLRQFIFQNCLWYQIDLKMEIKKFTNKKTDSFYGANIPLKLTVNQVKSCALQRSPLTHSAH